MVQKEVADRMQVGPGSKGLRRAVAGGSVCRAIHLANVPPNCFIPRPECGQAVITSLTRAMREPKLEVKDKDLMFRLIRASLQPAPEKPCRTGFPRGDSPAGRDRSRNRSLGLSPSVRGGDADAGAVCSAFGCAWKIKLIREI